MSELKLFNQWETGQIQVHDLGLQPYITLAPTLVPKTGAKYAGYRFHKSRVHIVERLINKIMVPGHRGKKHKISSGHCTGKTQTNIAIVRDCFAILEKKTGKNPVEVYVRALENAAPREEVVTIEYGGARYPKAVDMAPQRRIDQTLKIMVQGAYQKSYNSKRGFAEYLADEILNAYNMNPSSNAIAKKLEMERQADSSR